MKLAKHRKQYITMPQYCTPHGLGTPMRLGYIIEDKMGSLLDISSIPAGFKLALVDTKGRIQYLEEFKNEHEY